jgi:hypothetical protein
MENQSLSVAAILSLGLICAGPVQAEAAATPDDWQLRLDKSAALMAEGQARLDSAERKLAEQNAACYKKFFVNACRGDARSVFQVESREAKRLKAEAKAIELQVKKEQRDARDLRAQEEAPLRAAEREALAAEKEAAAQAAAAERAAHLADKARQAEEGAQRKLENEARLQQKREAHDARVAAAVEEANRKAAEAAPRK